jgi:hypothetical protein
MLIQVNKPLSHLPSVAPTTELTNLNPILFCGISIDNADASESISNLNRKRPKLRIVPHYLIQYSVAP